MVRRGRYTKKKPVHLRVKHSLIRRIQWFKRLPRSKKIALVAAPVLAFLVLTPLATYAYYYNDIADKDRLMNRNNTGVVLYDQHGEEFYSLGTAKHRELVSLADISDITEKALLSSEDKNFYSHSGFSLLSILKALYANITSGDVTAYGGSTLTQQLAKNTLLSANQTFLRKYQELFVAVAIEQRYDKDDILAMYLNSVYFGNDSFGIEEAAENYFAKKPSDLTLSEASMLIGVLPAPSAYSPVTGNAKYAKERQATVLERMVKNGVITEAEKEAAYNQELVYQPVKTISNDAPHFTSMVLSELYDEYGEETVKRSGYQVTTSLDLSLQRSASEAVTTNLQRIRAKGGSNAGVVAIDSKTGQIRALVGSIDYTNPEFGQVNIATSKRQPGSSFKPIYYARAMADDIVAPASIIRDEKTTFGDWTPKNASGRFYGNVSVRQALGWSLNIPAVKGLEQVGVETAISQAQAMGITTLTDSSNYGLTLALGSAEVPLTEMTNVYATFANEGQYKDTTTVASIKNKFNKQIYTAKAVVSQAISKQGAYLISNVLSDNASRTAIFGSSLNVYGTDNKLKQVAVKTGTTDDSRDGWTIGYTPEIAVGVWVGNNDNTPMLSGGAETAGPVWKAIMRHAIGTSVPEFVEPTGVVKQEACIGGVRSEDYYLLSTRLAVSCQGVGSTENDIKPSDETTPAPQVQDETTSSGAGDGDTDGSDSTISPDSSSGSGESGDSGTGGTTLPPILPVTP